MKGVNLIKGAIIAGSFIAGMNPVMASDAVEAASAYKFLNTIGACVHIQHGQDAGKIAPLLKYVGVRNVRDAADRNYDMSGLLQLSREAGVKVVIGPGSGAIEKDLDATLEMARQLHHHGALLAIEGPNEPNNFGGLTYKGKKGGRELSWLPVAEFQRDLYEKIKMDDELKGYPVYGISETGAMTDNCGLQFLEIPENEETLLESGTKFADFANCHNYMYHPSWAGAPHDNQVWNASDPTKACRADGLYGNHGKTWMKGFKGYEERELETLPRVTTETGVRVGDCDGAITEYIQGCNYMNLFLSQFKRGWDKTFIYEFIDDPDGSFGFYGSDYVTKRKAADYMHNFTTLLNDDGEPESYKSLDYSYSYPLPETVHDLLLQKRNGELWLIVWGECVNKVEKIEVMLPPEIKSVMVYDPVESLGAIGGKMRNDDLEPQGMKISLEVSDHPLLIKLADQ